MQTNHIAKGLFCEGEVAAKGTTGCGWPPLEKPGHADPPAMASVVGWLPGIGTAAVTGRGLELLELLKRELRALALE